MLSQATRERWIAFLLVLPSIILLGIFVYGFIAWTGRVSTSQWDGIEPNYTWAGLDNYRELFSIELGGIAARRFHTVCGTPSSSPSSFSSFASYSVCC